LYHRDSVQNVAEIVVHEGVDLSGAMVEQCFGVLRTFLRTSFCLLVSECNSHSYDFAAQTALGAVDGLLAVALVSDKPLMDMAACSLMRLPRPTRWHYSMLYIGVMRCGLGTWRTLPGR
jgi:hypothetical protein